MINFSLQINGRDLAKKKNAARRLKRWQINGEIRPLKLGEVQKSLLPTGKVQASGHQALRRIRTHGKLHRPFLGGKVVTTLRRHKEGGKIETRAGPEPKGGKSLQRSRTRGLD